MPRFPNDEGSGEEEPKEEEPKTVKTKGKAAGNRGKKAR